MILAMSGEWMEEADRAAVANQITARQRIARILGSKKRKNKCLGCGKKIVKGANYCGWCLRKVSHRSW